MASDTIKDSVSYRNLHEEFIDFAVKKTERLTSAIYLVSDLIPTSEPLKTVLREKGLGMLSDVFAVVGFSKAKEGKEDVVLKIITGLSELISLLRIASASAIISEMNSNILQKECANIRGFFESRGRGFGQPFGKEIIFNDNFFGNDNERPRINAAAKDKGHQINKGHDIVSKTYNINETLQIPNSAKDSTKTPIKKETTGISMHNESLVQEERKKTIVQLIKDSNGNVNIKDISSRVKGCSEKTLQRDLIALMQKGILKKSGERRWSRYSLAR